MTGPAWEGGTADPRSAQFGFDPPTVPLPFGSAPAQPQGGPPGRYDDPYGGAPHGPAGGYPPSRPRRRWRRLRRLAGALLVLVMLAVVAFGALLLITPSVSNAPALSRAFDRVHHVAYPGPPVPALFAESLVATEDHRFYSEPGIDVFAIARVIEAAITRRGDQGGATLYQQLAKMLYTPQGTGLRAQGEQVILGVKLDVSYSKPQILRMYSDVAYFGHGYYGLAQASCGYFGTAPAGLTLPEAATLAAWSRPRRRTTRSRTTRKAGPARRTCCTAWWRRERSARPRRLPRSPARCTWSAGAAPAAPASASRPRPFLCLTAASWPSGPGLRGLLGGR